MVLLGRDAPPGGEETQAKQPRCGGDADGGITEGVPGLRRHSGQASKDRWDSARWTRWGGHAGGRTKSCLLAGCVPSSWGHGACLGHPPTTFKTLRTAAAPSETVPGAYAAPRQSLTPTHEGSPPDPACRAELWLWALGHRTCPLATTSGTAEHTRTPGALSSIGRPCEHVHADPLGEGEMRV